MKFSSKSSLALGALSSLPAAVLALSAGDASAMYNSWNKVFLIDNGTYSAYRINITGPNLDHGWTNAYDLFVPQDVWYLSGDNSTRDLVDRVSQSFLNTTSPGKYGNWRGQTNYNDDLGWYTLAMFRSYQITGNTTYLNYSRAGFDYGYARGWNASDNDGGIMENQPNGTKQGLSNDSLGKVACYLYQATRNSTYLDKCTGIYDWVTNHIFNATTGQIYNSIDSTGYVEKVNVRLLYNQGTFIGYAALLYKMTGNTTYYNHAKLAMDFGRNNISSPVDQIFSDNNCKHQGWADEYARWGGGFVADNNLWSEYYNFFKLNAQAILDTRRTDLNITWNQWTKNTSTSGPSCAATDGPNVPLRYAAAPVWLQYTPPVMPTSKFAGLRSFSSKQSGLYVDSADAWGNGKSVVQSTKAKTQAQRWQFTQNSDGTWNIINLSTWQALQSDAANGNAVQWQPTRNPPQRWTIEEQPDGSVKISNTANGLVLDNAGKTTSGTPLVQSQSNGADSQRWYIY